MKKLLTAALIFTAASLSAVESPPPPVYCDCVGVGYPQKPVQSFRDAKPSARKEPPQGFMAHALFEIELWVILFEHGVYK